MKTLEQLGISPAPWHIEKNTGVLCAKSERYKHPIVDDCGNFENNNDKLLIAAAPDLYEALREAILAECIGCRYCGPHPKYECDNHDCRQAPAKWRAALAKAAGESEVK